MWQKTFFDDMFHKSTLRQKPDREGTMVSALKRVSHNVDERPQPRGSKDREAVNIRLPARSARPSHPNYFLWKVFKYSSIHISEYPEKVLCRSQEWLLDKFYKSTGDPHLCSSLRIPPVGFCLKNEQLTNLQCKCVWRHKNPPETERIVALGNILGHLHLIPANQVLRLLSLPHNLLKI